MKVENGMIHADNWKLFHIDFYFSNGNVLTINTDWYCFTEHNEMITQVGNEEKITINMNTVCWYKVVEEPIPVRSKEDIFFENIFNLDKRRNEDEQ